MSVLPRHPPVIQNIGSRISFEHRHIAQKTSLVSHEELFRSGLGQTQDIAWSALARSLEICISRLNRGHDLRSSVRGLPHVEDEYAHVLLLEEDEECEEDNGGLAGEPSSLSAVDQARLLRRKRAKERLETNEEQYSDIQAATEQRSKFLSLMRLPAAAGTSPSNETAPTNEENTEGNRENLSAPADEKSTTQNARSKKTRKRSKKKKGKVEPTEEEVLSGRVFSIERSAVLHEACNTLSSTALWFQHEFERIQRGYCAGMEPLRIQHMERVAAEQEAFRRLNAAVNLQSVGRGMETRRGELQRVRRNYALLRLLARVSASFLERKKFSRKFCAVLLENHRERAATKIQSVARMAAQREKYLDIKIQRMSMAVVVRCMKQWVEECRRRQIVTVQRLAEEKWQFRWSVTSLFHLEGQERSMLVGDEHDTINKLFYIFKQGLVTLERLALVHRFLQQEETTGARTPFTKGIRVGTVTTAIDLSDQRLRRERNVKRPLSASVVIQATDTRRRKQLLLAQVELLEAYTRQRIEFDYLSTVDFYRVFHQRFVYRVRSWTEDGLAMPCSTPPSLTLTDEEDQKEQRIISESGWDEYWRAHARYAYEQLPPPPPKETAIVKQSFLRSEIVADNTETESAVAERERLAKEAADNEKAAQEAEAQRQAELEAEQRRQEEAAELERQRLTKACSQLQRYYRMLRGISQVDSRLSEKRGQLSIQSFNIDVLQRHGRGFLARRQVASTRMASAVL